MDPYAKPGERHVGDKRPRVKHVPPDVAREMTPAQRHAQKQQVVVERRAIKKSARRALERELRDELNARD